MKDKLKHRKKMTFEEMKKMIIDMVESELCDVTGEHLFDSEGENGTEFEFEFGFKTLKFHYKTHTDEEENYIEEEFVLLNEKAGGSSWC